MLQVLVQLNLRRIQLNKVLIITILCLLNSGLFSNTISWLKIPETTFIVGEKDFVLQPLEYGAEDDELTGDNRPDKYIFWGHEVKVDEYYISEYEISVTKFKEFVDATRYKYEFYDKYKKHFWDKFNSDNQPIIYLSIFDIHAYTQYLSLKYNQNIRIATEAEWELAAKGYTENRYPWGTDFKVIIEDKSKSSRDKNSIYGYEEDISPFGVKGMFGAKAALLDVFSYDYFCRSSYLNPLNIEGTKNFVTTRGGGDYATDDGFGILLKGKSKFSQRTVSTIRLVKTDKKTIFNEGEADEVMYDQKIASIKFKSISLLKKPYEESEIIQTVGSTDKFFILFRSTKLSIFNGQEGYWYWGAIELLEGKYNSKNAYMGWVHGSQILLTDEKWFKVKQFP